MAFYESYCSDEQVEYVSPQYLINATNSTVIMAGFLDSHTKTPSINSSNHNFGIKLEDVGTLQPGAYHQLSQDPIPTPQSILDGSYQAALSRLHNHRDSIFLLPRLAAYIGTPTIPSIVFSVNGQPGPSLGDLFYNRVSVDGAFDFLFREKLWKQWSLTVDWPGVVARADYIPCVDEEQKPLNRMQVANIVAQRIYDIFTPNSQSLKKRGPQVITEDNWAWDLRNIDYHSVRLIAINYYVRTWVPVLAVSVSA